MNNDIMIQNFFIQVLTFLRPGLLAKDNQKHVAINLVLANKYFNCEQSVTQEMKKSGKWNVTVCLLDEDSRDDTLKPKINGKYRKCVVIPQSMVSKVVLDSLYKGEITECHS